MRALSISGRELGSLALQTSNLTWISFKSRCLNRLLTNRVHPFLARDFQSVSEAWRIISHLKMCTALSAQIRPLKKALRKLCSGQQVVHHSTTSRIRIHINICSNLNQAIAAKEDGKVWSHQRSSPLMRITQVWFWTTVELQATLNLILEVLLLKTLTWLKFHNPWTWYIKETLSPTN